MTHQRVRVLNSDWIQAASKTKKQRKRETGDVLGCCVRPRRAASSTTARRSSALGIVLFREAWRETGRGTRSQADQEARFVASIRTGTTGKPTYAECPDICRVHNLEHSAKILFAECQKTCTRRINNTRRTISLPSASHMALGKDTLCRVLVS